MYEDEKKKKGKNKDKIWRLIAWPKKEIDSGVKGNEDKMIGIEL